jgi:hypothetical protein
MRSLLLAIAACCALAAPASASPALDIGIADDRVLFEGSDLEALAAVAEYRALGVDTVRIHARWVAHVAEPLSRTVPRNVDRRDPAGGLYHWDRLDRAVALVRGAGLKAMLTVTGSGPLWGTLDPSQGSPRVKPSPALFAEFATAVARRYRAQVDEYVIWNEPNHELWLQPQNTCSRGRCRPYAPHLYRKIVRAAEPAIRGADPGARVMMGALAPRGTSGRSRNARLRPLVFLRAMGCVDARYRRVRSGDCRGFAPASSYGFAYHPHGVTFSPTQGSKHPDEVQLGDIAELVTALDRVTRSGGLRARHPSGRFPLYLDEYGYETNPPDRGRGVSNALQSTYLQQAGYLAWQHPRVRNLTQYAWKDEPMRSDGAGWQSGLRRQDGRPKGVLATFKHPFWAERRSARSVRLWGQVRPGGSRTVTIQRRSSTGAWRTLTRAGTDPRGFFRREVATRSGGTYRFRYVDAAGATQTSSTRTVRR